MHGISSILIVGALLPLLIHSSATFGADQSAVESQRFDPCASTDDLSFSTSAALNKVLLEIDSFPGTSDMLQAHFEIMKTLQGTLNYCGIERRLRQLKAKTYLLAVPYEAVSGPTRAYSLSFPMPRFPTWSRIPKYSVWYERNGEVAAKKKLIDSGMVEADNLINLNRAGVLIPASNKHALYTTIESPNRTGLNPTYDGLYRTLEKYRASGALTNEYNPMLMQAASDYLSRQDPKIKFSINEAPSGELLQFYVIEKDPERILSYFPCNCAFVPRSNLIICDKKLLAALANWVTYGKGTKNLPSQVHLMNDAIADLLLYWLVGHEIGHFTLKHEYDARFLGFGSPTLPAVPPSVPITKQIETDADGFALQHMPASVQGWGHMATNFIIQQLVAHAKLNTATATAGDTKQIVVREPAYGHPNFLLRAYSLKEATGAVDFLLEQHQANTVSDPARGATLPGICTLAQ